MNVDLLIKGGHVIDPSTGENTIRDVAVHNKKLVELGRDVAVEAKQIIDANGYFVSPGFVDAHCHLNYLGSCSGISADAALLPMGITAAADAGSVGISNFPAMLHQLEFQQIKSRLYLNVSAGGQIMSQHYPENLDDSKWNDDMFSETIKKSAGRIVGFKIRTSRKVVGERGIQPLKSAISLADRFQMPLVVHPSDPPIPMGELAQMLQPGSILCHIYHGMGKTAVEESGISKGLMEAQKRGVLYDVAHGRANFSYPIAEKALEHGLRPDIISSDLSAANWNQQPLLGLPNVMSKFLHLGFSLQEVLDLASTRPAKMLGMGSEWGTLRAGTCADITLFQLNKTDGRFEDAYGNKRSAKTVIVPKATILDGRIVYRSTDLN